MELASSGFFDVLIQLIGESFAAENDATLSGKLYEKLGRFFETFSDFQLNSIRLTWNYFSIAVTFTEKFKSRKGKVLKILLL